MVKWTNCRSFPQMSDILKDGRKNNIILERFYVDGSTFAAMRAGLSTGTYMRLKEANGFNNIIMSDTPMERRTNREVIFNANGDVLIAGLGLGMILFALEANPRVKSITVIEKSSEVIELVWSQIKGYFTKVRLIQADIFEWSPRKKDSYGNYYFEKGFKFDTIYFDIWNYVNSDVYKDSMLVLKQKYRPFIKTTKENPDRYFACWAEYYARYDRPLC